MTLNKSQKQLFKKTNLAIQLLEQVPLKFKKKIRQLIDEYEKQKINLIRKLNKQGTQIVQFNLKNSAQTSESQIKVNLDVERSALDKYKQKLQRIQQQKFPIYQQNKNLIQQLKKKSVQLENKQSQLNQVKSTLLYFKQNLQFQELQHNQKVCILTKQRDQLTKIVQSQLIQIKHLQKHVQQLGKENQKKQSQIFQLKSTLNQTQIKLKQVSNELKKKKVAQLTKQINKKQLNQSNTYLNTPNYSNDDSEQRSRQNSSYRKPSQNLNQSTNTKKIMNYNILLNSINKVKQSITKNKNEDLDDNSETQSIQFGKQKVIQKKRIKKLFIQLMNSEKSRKKQKAMKIANEICLKSKEISQFTEMFS